MGEQRHARSERGLQLALTAGRASHLLEGAVDALLADGAGGLDAGARLVQPFRGRRHPAADGHALGQRLK